MPKFLCILLVVILCGCTTDQQRPTFKEKYNIYADPVIDHRNKVIPIPGAEPYPAQVFRECGLQLSELEDFINAIVRRMDAKNLTEYHAIQDRMDTLFRQFHQDLEMDKNKTLYTSPEGKAYRVLLDYYMIRTEDRLKIAFATVQYMKYQLEK